LKPFISFPGGTLSLTADKDSRRTLGPAFDAARIKEKEQKSAIDTERYYSDPEEGCGLEKPTTPALLPPFPTSTALAIKDLEDSIRKQRKRNQEVRALMQAVSGKKDAASTETKALAAPDPST